MKRVLEVFGEPISYGGQEAFFFSVLQHMDRDGLRIDVFTPYYCDNEHSRNMVRQYGGELFEIGLPFEPGKSRTNIYQPLAAHLKENGYDVIHIHSGSISVLALAALAAKRAKAKKIIVHSHATGTNKTIKYRLTKACMTPFLNDCPTDYCACSAEAGEWKFSRKAMKKLIILKNGIELDRFRYSQETRRFVRENLGIGQDDFVIGHVGRFSLQKNQEFIIELLSQLKNRIPGIKAVFVGDGETMQAIRDLVQKKDLADSVRFIGNVGNVQDYLQAMDVFLFPSRFEGLGIVGVEAQANGMRVIASTNVPKDLGITSLVEFISLEDKQKWINAILQTQNQRRTDVSEQLRAAGYDVKDTADEVRNLYRQ